MSVLVHPTRDLGAIFDAHEQVFPRLDLLTDNAVGIVLAHLLSHISEEYYCAGWLYDIEFRAWNHVTGQCQDQDFVGRHPLLNRLHERLAGGWVWYGLEGVELLTPAEWADRRDLWAGKR